MNQSALKEEIQHMSIYSEAHNRSRNWNVFVVYKSLRVRLAKFKIQLRAPAAPRHQTPC